MRVARRQAPLFDLGMVIILLCAMSLVAIVALHFAGYPVPMWAVGVVLSLCLVVALVIGVGFVRRGGS
jgi:hypothetical protein